MTKLAIDPSFRAHVTVVRLRRPAWELGSPALERANQYRLYELAVGLRKLPAYTENVVPIEAIMLLRSMRRALLPYCGENPPIRLTVSLGAAKELIVSLDDLEIEIPKLMKAGKLLEGDQEDQYVESWRFNSVRNALEKFEAVLSAECETRPAFVAPRRGIYDTEELVNAAANAIPEALRPMLSAKASVELDSAGRCLAFGLFTAAGFHMCRAIEAVMEAYYQRFTGKPGTLNSWHDYIGALEKAVAAGYKPTAERQTLAYLNQLRDSSRNPIMHPRVILEEADASELFDLGRGAICRMAKELLAASRPVRRKKLRMKAVP